MTVIGDADVIKRIHSKGPFEQEEYVAAEAGIYPGMLVELDTDGNVIKHDVSGGAVGDETLVAMEDQIQGKTVDDVYADEAIVTVMIPAKGTEVNLLLKDGAVVTPGVKVMSNGDGTIIVNSGGVHIPGMSTGSLDLTGSSNTANALTPVRIV